MSANISSEIAIEARRTTLVWLLLSSATAASWWLGIESVLTSRRMATLVILAIAMIKIRFVIRYFMNVRSAPTVLKVACDIWVIALGAAMITLYWMEKT